MAEIRGYDFSDRIYSGVNELAISDIIVNFLNRKSVCLPTLNQVETFKTVDGRSVQSPGQVQIIPVLKTSAGKCRICNLQMLIVPDKDQNIRNGAAWTGEIVLGNPFLLRAGFNVADFVADNMDRLSLIDYSYINTTTEGGKIGKLGSEILQVDRSPNSPDIELE